ncbi:hypothetical protein GCM10025868_03650 [Angustibacter aerolatus]|uniref:Uncharacterized protein n=1 Tax=Angustibacter aerolatus TaxID=1162965 RepID=A0ABQ6JD38_9ACTN|nr:hypothetical protein GCM10025868_03650 [Angustibacter aerolatus]
MSVGLSSRMRPSRPFTKPGDSSVDRLRARLDGLADGDGVGYVVVVEHLPRAEPQHRAVDRRHPLERPALGVGGDELVEPLALGDDALDEHDGVVVDRRVGLRQPVGEHRHGRDAALVGLEEDVDGALARLRAGCHGVPVRLTRPR